MAVTFTTQDPTSLLKAFDARISQADPKGKITTWKKHTDGVHYTHKADNWTSKAFFKPSIQVNQLIFHIIKPSSSGIDTVVYAYYHGHLIETFLNHFDTSFSAGSASAQPQAGDFCVSR